MAVKLVAAPMIPNSIVSNKLNVTCSPTDTTLIFECISSCPVIAKIGPATDVAALIKNPKANINSYLYTSYSSIFHTKRIFCPKNNTIRKKHNPKIPANRPILRNASFKYSISPSAYFLAILGIEERWNAISIKAIGVAIFIKILNIPTSTGEHVNPNTKEFIVL